MAQSAKTLRPQETPVARALHERGEVLDWLRRHPALARASAPRRVVQSGFAELDALLDGGLPCGAITALGGTAGGTSIALAALAAATRRGEVVAWVDAGDALDPRSLAAAGAELERFLWIRPPEQSGVRQALKAADLVLDAGGFALVALDLGGARTGGTTTQSRSWVRLTRRLEGGGTSLLVLGDDEAAGFSASTRLDCLRRRGAGFEVGVRVVRRRGSAPTGSVVLTFSASLD